MPKLPIQNEPKENHCPKCGDEITVWHGTEELDQSMRYDYTCSNPNCQFEGQEWHSLVFSGHCDDEGNDIQ